MVHCLTAAVNRRARIQPKARDSAARNATDSESKAGCGVSRDPRSQLLNTINGKE